MQFFFSYCFNDIFKDYFIFLFSFFNINNKFIILDLFSKEDIIIMYNLMIAVYYKIYKFFKNIILYCYFNILQLYMILIYSNTFNKFFSWNLYNFFKLKKKINYIIKFFFRRLFKKRRWWKLYYKFGWISYLKIFFFGYLFLIFFLMLKRRNTYLKRSFFVYLVTYYIMVIMLANVLVPYFEYSFFGIFLCLFISFFAIFFKLN